MASVDGDWEDEGATHDVDDEVPSVGTVEEGLEGVEFHESDRPMLEALVNDSNYVGRRLSTNISVPGSISKPQFRSFWKNVLKPSKEVMNIVENGYKLPFETTPPPSFEKNNASARRETSFVKAEVKRLLQLGCIEEVSEKPYIVNPLSVVFSKKLRLVVDSSRCINPYLRKMRVRLQDLREIPSVIHQGDWMACDDLDSGQWRQSLTSVAKKLSHVYPFLLPIML